MSKVEIIGPKQIAEQVLESLRQCGTLHLQQETDLPSPRPLACLADNPEVLSRQLYYQDALEEIASVLKLIPETRSRLTYLNNADILPSLLSLSKKHLRQLTGLQRQQQEKQSELMNLQLHIELLRTLQPLLHEQILNHQLGMVAIKLSDPALLKTLREQLSRRFDGAFELLSCPMQDQAMAIAILLPRADLKKLQEVLTNAQIPEQYHSSGHDHTSLEDQIIKLDRTFRGIEGDLQALDHEFSTFQRRWGPYYTSCNDWLEQRIALHAAHSVIHETAMCFAIVGWVPSDQLVLVRSALENHFSGTVTLNELEIHTQEMDDVPIILQNLPYFRPFEIFTRLLPLPRYTSLDPTPFLGIFFPIFFGMILGDAGYALILLSAGVSGWFIFKQRPLIQDACRVLTVCAGYTALFGILYGEFFGEQGAHMIGLTPLVMSRSGTLMPMLYFSLAVGGFHILMGLTLGACKSLLLRHVKEGAFRMLSLLIVVGLITIGLTFFYPDTVGLRTPLLIAIGIALPMLIITGGFLAPLEMLKHIGHIISYTRIMAVGMTSVMLAYVANRLAGEAGSLAAGIAVAFLLHLFNLLLGIFAPTVHALRLHYVEFFSKFYESGGRQYTPFKAAHKHEKGDLWKT